MVVGDAPRRFSKFSEELFVAHKSGEHKTEFRRRFSGTDERFTGLIFANSVVQPAKRRRIIPSNF